MLQLRWNLSSTASARDKTVRAADFNPLKRARINREFEARATEAHHFVPQQPRAADAPSPPTSDAPSPSPDSSHREGQEIRSGSR